MLAASAGAIVLGSVPTTGAAAAEELRTVPESASGAPLKQSVSYWPFESIPLPQFARELKAIGFSGLAMNSDSPARSHSTMASVVTFADRIRTGIGRGVVNR